MLKRSAKRIENQKMDSMINKKSKRGYVLARSKMKCDEKTEGSGLKEINVGQQE